MVLELSEHDFSLLRTALAEHIDQERMMLANTDSHSVRREFADKVRELEQLLARLEMAGPQPEESRPVF